MSSALSRVMNDAECRALLAGQRVCVMSLVDGEDPYAVPVFYGLDADALIVGLSDGRKTRVIDRNPRVCVTVTEVRPDGFWQSVQVQGQAHALTSDAERAAAIAALVAHNRRLGHAPPAGSMHRPVTRGRLVRIENARITGRAKA